MHHHNQGLRESEFDPVRSRPPPGCVAYSRHSDDLSTVAYNNAILSVNSSFSFFLSAPQVRTPALYISHTGDPISRKRARTGARVSREKGPTRAQRATANASEMHARARNIQRAYVYDPARHPPRTAEDRG